MKSFDSARRLLRRLMSRRLETGLNIGDAPERIC